MNTYKIHFLPNLSESQVSKWEIFKEVEELLKNVLKSLKEQNQG